MAAPAAPIAQFLHWQRQAEGRGSLRRLLASWRGEAPWLAQSAALATADADGRPAVRMVLIKDVSESGFTFYTNYASRKAHELDQNPRASLLFYWPRLARQVRVEGPVARLSREQNERYWRTRPRGSQIGAWASRQSSRVCDDWPLVERVHRFRREFAGRPVPCPEFWGGYLLRPERLEFWQARPDRLHDRLCYVRAGQRWESFRLMP